MWKKWMAVLVAGMALAMTATACGGDPPADCSNAPTFKACVTPIFDKSCGGSGCHGATSPSNGLTLVGIDASALVGKDSTNAKFKLVVANDLKQSYIYQKLLATSDREADVTGSQMPPGSALNAADLAVVKAWIEGGAKP